MKKIKKTPPRNFFVLAMTLHCKAGKMKKRGAPRGGSKNRQQEWRDEANDF